MLDDVVRRLFQQYLYNVSLKFLQLQAHHL